MAVKLEKAGVEIWKRLRAHGPAEEPQEYSVIGGAVWKGVVQGL